MKTKFLYISILALFLANFSSGQVPASEKAALQALYTATDGGNWTNNTGWDFSTPVITWDPTTQTGWYGITLNNEGHVHFLRLSENNLQGEIPSEIGQLLGLRELILADNNLIGSIPSEIGQLSSLLTLQLASNDLSGNIPGSLGDLDNLTGLVFSYNDFSGVLPDSLGDLDSILYLYLNQNNFSGNIPVSLGNLGTLFLLDLSQNNLIGGIPMELGQLSNLRTLDLANNSNLGGVFPPELGQLSKLELLFFSSCDLIGPIPPEIGQMSQLQQVYVDDNTITVPLPSEIGQLSNLLILSMHDCSIPGEIPPSIGQLINLQTLSLSNNNLVGSIPLELEQLSSIRRLSFGNNKLSGNIPDFRIPSLLTFSQAGFLVSSNGFRFIDFEDEFIEYSTQITNFGNNSFTYSPQAKIDQEQTITKQAGASVTFTMFEDNYFSNNNTYQWYKGVYPSGTAIVGETNREYTINNVSLSDSGDYYCLANNTIVNGLTLEKNPIHLSVQEASCTVNNPNSDSVGGLVINLIDYLIVELQNGANPSTLNGTSPQQLLDLLPYVTDLDKGVINNFQFIASTDEITGFSFAFSASDNDYDIRFRHPYAAPLSSSDPVPSTSSIVMDLSNYSDPNTLVTFDGGQFIDLEVRHIDFCSDEIVSCTASNPNSEVVEDLFLNLVQHITARVQNNDPIASINGSSPPELIALLPYITDPDKGVINNFFTDYDNDISFSFSPNDASSDVVFATHTLPTVNLTGVDIDLGNYSGSNTLFEINQLPLFDKLLFKHIDFCPDELVVPCDDNLTGTITASTSVYCIDTPFNFYLQTTVPINTFAWTINQ